MKQEEIIMEINRDIQAIDQNIEKIKRESIWYSVEVIGPHLKIPVNWFGRFPLGLIAKIKTLITLNKKHLLVHPLKEHV